MDVGNQLVDRVASPRLGLRPTRLVRAGEQVGCAHPCFSLRPQQQQQQLPFCIISNSPRAISLTPLLSNTQVTADCESPPYKAPRAAHLPPKATCLIADSLPTNCATFSGPKALLCASTASRLRLSQTLLTLSRIATSRLCTLLRHRASQLPLSLSPSHRCRPVVPHLHTRPGFTSKTSLAEAPILRPDVIATRAMRPTRWSLRRKYQDCALPAQWQATT